jgi:tRNA pseudouridine38-40 synthase
MRNIALKLMYVGTAYHGWQVQKTEIPWPKRWKKLLQPWYAIQ